MNRWRSRPAPGRRFAGKGNRSMKVIIVGGVAGGASCAARLRRLDEGRRNPHGGARTLRFLRELRAALPCRRRHQGGGEPPGRDRGAFPRALRHRCAHELRGNRNFAQREKGQAARRAHRRGERARLRQVGAVAGRGVDPPAAAGDRPSGNLPCPHRARRPADQRMDRVAPHRGRSQAPRGGRWRRLHRPGDGREPRASRLRGDGRGVGRAGSDAGRRGIRPRRRGPPREAWRQACAERRRGRVRARRRERAQGARRNPARPTAQTS